VGKLVRYRIAKIICLRSDSASLQRDECVFVSMVDCNSSVVVVEVVVELVSSVVISWYGFDILIDDNTSFLL